MSVHYDSIILSTLRGLQPGCRVVTADGQELGTLAEVRGEYVKVHASLRPDYWLHADFVLGCDDGRVDVSFIKDDLKAYRLSEPAQSADPKTAQAPDGVISEEEQIGQRMRMEAELAEQRQRLAHLHPSGETAPPDTLGTIGEPVESELERLEQEYGPVTRRGMGDEPGDGRFRGRIRDFVARRDVRWWAGAAAALAAGSVLWMRARRR